MKYSFSCLLGFLLLITAAGCSKPSNEKGSETAAPNTVQVKSETKSSMKFVAWPASPSGTNQGNPQSSPAKTDDKSKEVPQKTELKRIKQDTVKGIYVTGRKANGKSLDSLIKLVDKTDLNAMVIDVKNDSGQVTYDSNVPLANEIGADDPPVIADIRGLLQRLKDKNIYTIARVVAFKDPYLSSIKNDFAMHAKSGKVWKDKKGVAWVDPYNENVRNYNIQLAKEAVSLGFDEVQFDYVRFPENGNKVDQEAHFDNPNQWSKADVIGIFLKKAKEELKDATVSADVFGLTSSAKDDMGIGQNWEDISPEIDYISPMVYPSHYSNGALGIKHPDLQPYAVIKKAMTDAKQKNDRLIQQNKKTAVIRPWFQDFTATWVSPHQTYGAAQVREQMKAAKELGIDQFLLWNPACTYSYR